MRDAPDVEVTKKKAHVRLSEGLTGECECGENCVRQVSRVTLRLRRECAREEWTSWNGVK
jgi:hypothetical protein